MLSRFSILSALPLLFVVFSLQAQPTPEGNETSNPFGEEVKDGVRLLGAIKGDSILLRWGPTTPKAWLAGNRAGYIVERLTYSIGSGDTIELQADLLTKEPLHPWTQTEWNERIGSDTSRQWLIVAQQVLFNETATKELGSSDNSFGALRMNAVELQNRHGIALFAADNDPEAAEGLALRFVDYGVDTGSAYRYRVYIAITDSTIADAYEIGYSDILFPGIQEVRQEPHGVYADGGDGAITIAWEEVYGGGFSGYWIEREEREGVWRTLNSNPIVYMGAPPEPISQIGSNDSLVSQQIPNALLSYTDSSIVNYQLYRYRVRGRDPFGDLTEGVIVEGMGRDLTPPARPNNVGSAEKGPNQVELRWEMEETSPDLAGFIINRGPTVDGPFRSITEVPVPATGRTYNVLDANESEAYYFIESVDTAGNRAASLTFLGAAIDRIPPAQPTGLTGVVDTSGIITIRWNRGPENDILGYRVYFANDSTDEFSLIHNDLINDTLFVDSLRIQTATNEIFYRVKAFDTRRSQSPMSEIVMVKQPDLLPPNARAFGEITPTDSSVILRWHRGRARDVVEQVVLRRPIDGDRDWSEIARVDGETDQWEDTTTDREEMYNYTIYAIDGADLRSDSALPIYAGSFNRPAIPTVTNLAATFNREAGTIQLQWKFAPPADQRVERLVLYRASLTGSFERYHVLDPASRTFTATDAWDEPAWKYAVGVETDQGESRLSEAVIVVVN